MPVKEKHVLSPRYLWKILIYAMNAAFLVMAFSMAQNMYRVSDTDRINYYMSLMTGLNVRSSGTLEQLAKIIAALCLLSFLGLLITMYRMISNELTTREEADRLLFAIGYRKRDILWYEEAYVMFDLVCTYAIALLLTWILQEGMNRVTYVSALNTALKQAGCMRGEAYFVTGIAVTVAVGIGTAKQILLSKPGR